MVRVKKFKFLITFGLKKRFFKKSFIITNALLGLIIIAVVNIPAIISYFSTDEEVTQTVRVVNETDDQEYPLEATLIDTLNQTSDEMEYTVYEGTFDDFWETEGIDIWLVFTGDLSNPEVDVHLKDMGQQTLVMSMVQNVLNDYQDINYANFNVVQPPPSDDPGLDDDTRMVIENAITVLILPVVILIIMATQFLGVDIIEEKSSKVIETIISSVPATYHFLSKIIANVTFLFVQATLLLGFGVIGMLVSRLIAVSTDIDTISLVGELSRQIPNLTSIVVILALFSVFGALIFLSLAALIASVATTQEDYQQYQAPLIFLLLGGFYIGIFLPIMGADGLVHIAAYIPFFSTLVAPVAYATGVISLFETIMILLMLVAITGIFLYLITPIYKVAILSYEETRFFRRIGLYIKKAFTRRKRS